MAAYYNENDSFAAAWLRELIKAKLIADGDVDERSIAEVKAEDVRGYTQAHFFAGIGGWSYALRLAGWPDDRRVWTGSCPCQPFSSAGSQVGGNDSRDLWPRWYDLVRECRPPVVFGEQVEAAIGHGWLDRLCDDLESENYAIGACGLPAASVGAFHIRQRLWFVAESDGWDAEHGNLQRGWQHGLRTEDRRVDGHAREYERQEGAVADAMRRRTRRNAGAMDSPTGDGKGKESEFGRVALEVERRREAGDMADADGQRRTRERLLLRAEATGWDTGEVPQIAWCCGANFWSAAEWIPCRDGKARPVESGTFPLAHGIPARVGRLRGYGNAIVPQVAQVFIEAYMSLNR